MVEGFAALGRPFEQFHRPVHGDAFLVAGDQEGDRSLGLAAARGKVIERGGQRTGDRPFHIDRAAAIERAVGDLAGKRRVGPFRLLARRHHVGVAGEDEMRADTADAGIEVLDRGRARFGEGDAMDVEADGFQNTFDHAECAAVRRRHRRATEQVARERGGIGDRYIHRGRL